MRRWAAPPARPPRQGRTGPAAALMPTINAAVRAMRSGTSQEGAATSTVGERRARSAQRAKASEPAAAMCSSPSRPASTRPASAPERGRRQPRERHARAPSVLARRARVGEREAAQRDQPEQRRGSRLRRERRAVPLRRDQEHRPDDQRERAEHPADDVAPASSRDRRDRHQRRAERGGEEQGRAPGRRRASPGRAGVRFLSPP